MRSIAAGIALSLGVVGQVLAQQDATVYTLGPGVSAPTLVRDVKPAYTADALKRRVTGSVHLQCVVDREGIPTNLVVVRSLDEDLDKAALSALRQWHFEPGEKDGSAVPVQIQVEMVFTIAKRKRWLWFRRD